MFETCVLLFALVAIANRLHRELESTRKRLALAEMMLRISQKGGA